ncbi:MAG: ATP-binding protein [Candidatus Dormibacteraeota bacterium]|uniref:ATP-binding protein n=1 Tax=Candidatus Amunia macphersoniae TaxID=3127014 RepID=A0A934NF53_9BACT|nr:ATP-binding protein [Candidatus Dormibacteraeota bacterium]
MAVSLPVAASPTIALPPSPRTADETGLPFSFTCDLILKVLYFNGSMLGRDVAEHIRLPFSLVGTALKFLADEGYISTSGVRMRSLAPDEDLTAGMEHQISSSGRQRARELLELNQYAGPAPVPIGEYAAMAGQQAMVDGNVTRDRLHEAFSHLVLGQELLDHLGPALSARDAIFLHGPPGNGKTSIAEAAASLLGPPMFVPRALYVHGEVMRFFDPIHHVAIDRDLPPHDRRWQLVQRPAVKVGGELTPKMLELSFDPALGFYEASMQLKANGGLFLVDDFGRQQNMSPRDLLNRLIVPLEKHVDYANISRAGTTVAVPFTCLLILSTNLRPQNLMDEAFLRRVHFKVHVPDPTEAEYREVWRRRCAIEGLRLEEDVLTNLIATQYTAKGRPLHGSHPRDLLNHIVHAARYFGRPVLMTEELMGWACETYFVDEDAV